jgi:hypothetical protein
MRTYATVHELAMLAVHAEHLNSRGTSVLQEPAVRVIAGHCALTEFALSELAAIVIDVVECEKRFLGFAATELRSGLS